MLHKQARMYYANYKRTVSLQVFSQSLVFDYVCGQQKFAEKAT